MWYILHNKICMTHDISPEVAGGAEVRVDEGAVGHVSAAEARGSGHVAGGHAEAVHVLVLGGGGGPGQDVAAWRLL